MDRLIELQRCAIVVSQSLKEIASPDRLMMLSQLSRDEKSLGEIEELIGIQQLALYQQLGVLYAKDINAK